jgi:hypothetical protein
MVAHAWRRRTATAAASAAFFAPLAYGQPDARGSLASIDFGVALCVDAGKRAVVDATVAAAIKRAVRPAATGKRVGYRVVTCDDVLPDSSCFAQQKVLVCRESVVDRVLRAASWAIAKHQESTEANYEAFRLRVPRWSLDAVKYADGVTSSLAADRISPQLRETYTLLQAEPDSSLSALSHSEQVFAATVDYALAALIGHELSHVFEERCPVTSPARTEESGLVRKLLGLHHSGELFCPRNPSPEEVRADICGLRHIRLVSSSLAARGGDRQAIELAARLAADLVAFQNIFGWRPRPGVPAGSYGFLELRQYLYEPMRVLAYGVELSPSTGNQPPVCGESASLFVHGTQELSKRCTDGKGQVSDDILALVPKGVEDSWNGARWTQASFSCEKK